MTTAAGLPRVQGQHRNRALAAARRARAVALITEGLTYQQVADELGYSNKGTVYRLVHQALAKDTAGAVETLQELEVARLAVLRIVVARSRVLGVYDLRPLEPFSPRTVVLTGEDVARLGL